MKVRSYMYPLGLVREHVTENPEQTTEAKIGIYGLKLLKNLGLTLGLSLTGSLCICLRWPLF